MEVWNVPEELGLCTVIVWKVGLEGQNFPCAAKLKVHWKAIKETNANLHFSFTFLEWMVPV